MSTSRNPDEPTLEAVVEARASLPSTEEADAPAPTAEEGAGDRGEPHHPDRTGPRGNPPVEDQDLERGRGKLDRVIGW